jgi:hypothetical protein
MKKILTLAAALIVLGASTAMAAGGLNLFYSGCSADGNVATATFTCTVNTGNNQMTAAVVVPTDIPNFVAASCIIDVTVTGATLPAWWQTAAGQCRANQVSMSFDPSVIATANCADIWGGAPPLPVFAVQQGLHGPNTVRFNGGAALVAPNPLSTDAELVVAKLTVGHTKSVGTGSCAGCTAGACFVFNESKLNQPAGFGDYTVTAPAAGNFCTLNGGAPICPQATPTQNRTWGAVKSLYR